MKNRIKDLCLDILFPPYCLSCGMEGSFVCAPCTAAIPTLPPSCIGCGIVTPREISRPASHPAGHTCPRCKQKTAIAGFFSPLPYKHPLVRQLIHEFKYRRIRGISPLLAGMIASHLQYYEIILPEQCIIMPIPLHSRKERFRGFNQAHLLAEELSQHVSRPLNTRNLARVISRPAQAQLDAKHRHVNTENIFVLRNPAEARGKHIILVDDVKTTGATLEQAAFLLKKAGAKRIWAITAAH